MRLVPKILVAVIAILLVWVGFVFTISELGEEVVTLSWPESDNSAKKLGSGSQTTTISLTSSGAALRGDISPEPIQTHMTCTIN